MQPYFGRGNGDVEHTCNLRVTESLDLFEDQHRAQRGRKPLQRAFDPYAFVRDAWIQQREFQIFDGNPPPEQLEDFGDEAETPADAAPADEPDGESSDEPR